MSHVKVRSSTTYHILSAKFRELPIELYARKLTMGFQQRLAHLPSSWLVSQAASLSQHRLNKDLTLGTNQQPSRRHYGVYLIGKPTKPTTSKIALNDIKETFLAIDWNFSHLLMLKLDYHRVIVGWENFAQ